MRSEERMVIRKATKEDANSLLRIYSYYVENTAISFEYHQMDEESLSLKMQEIGYKDLLQTRTPLLNGKALIRMDFLKG